MFRSPYRRVFSSDIGGDPPRGGRFPRKKGSRAKGNRHGGNIPGICHDANFGLSEPLKIFDRTKRYHSDLSQRGGTCDISREISPVPENVGRYIAVFDVVINGER